MSDAQDRRMPPRYAPAGNFHERMTDELVRFARPVRWDIDDMPEPVRLRKQRLYDHHFYTRLAGWMRCDSCRPLVAGFFAEDGFRLPDEIPGDLAAFEAWSWSRHAFERCDEGYFIGQAFRYKSGVLTARALFIRLADSLYELFFQRTAEEQHSEYRLDKAVWKRALILDLVGPNPVHRPRVHPAWLTSTAVAIARQMYDSRDFSPMPILADALRDAGCEDAEVLDHCRGDGPHVRGCWVVDSILGRE